VVDVFVFYSQGVPGVNGKRGKQGPNGEQVGSEDFRFKEI
jgi:hypothetical protein